MWISGRNRMKNLEERVEGITENFIEMSKSVDRLMRINVEMLRDQKFNNALYGEAKLVEDRINAYEVKIKEDSIHTIVRFQPAAGDLRALLTYIECSKMLERMGDILLSDIKLFRKLEKKGSHLREHLETILDMAERVTEIFGNYTQAFVDKDENAIYALLGMDEEVDDLRTGAVNEILEIMKESPENVDGGALILLLAKKYERLSDKIMALGSGLVYTLNGEYLRKKELMRT
jgi:phosphate transport system protein